VAVGLAVASAVADGVGVRDATAGVLLSPQATRAATRSTSETNLIRRSTLALGWRHSAGRSGFSL
jgi:hypothetical protein